MSRPAKTDGATGDSLRPIICDPKDTLSVKEAARYGKVNETTVRKLVEAHQIAHRPFPAAPLRVPKLAFLMALHGDGHALALLRARQLNHPVVQSYADVAGVKL